MSKKTTSKTSKPASCKADTKAQAPRRRTRMIALEPRMLFDGALGLDLGTKATAIMRGDAPAGDATLAPASPDTQSTAAKAAEAERAQQPAQVVDASRTPDERKEVVFVDARVKDYQSQLAGVDPKAQIVFL